jgi:uncharacterized protein
MLQPTEIAVLVAGGLAAGVVNTLAGGGSLLTVPLLVMVGLPGTLANGTNRVGVLVQNLVAARRFRAAQVTRYRDALPVLLPLLLGSGLGALGAAQLSDAAFERLFGVLMLLLLVPTLRGATASARAGRRPGSPVLAWLVYFGVGLYGGSVQAGAGIFLVFALARGGSDLVRANAVKVVAMAAFTAVVVPVFALAGEIDWVAGGVLAAGFAVGGELGARLAVRGGERWIRPVLAAAVVALAARMLGLF